MLQFGEKSNNMQYNFSVGGIMNFGGKNSLDWERDITADSAGRMSEPIKDLENVRRNRVQLGAA